MGSPLKRGLRVNRKVLTRPDLDHANVGKYCTSILRTANVPLSRVYLRLFLLRKSKRACCFKDASQAVSGALGAPPYAAIQKTLLKKEREYFKKMKTALTIAGSDSSGGAGIQADLKTMTLGGVYAMSAITALTAQNTTGVSSIMEVTPHFLEEQLAAVFSDIFPDAVKIGMVSSKELILTTAQALTKYKAKHIVVDPVMVATSGGKLMKDDAVCTLSEALFPLAELVTPNISEAEVLADMTISSAEDMETAAKEISARYGCAVLCKGGHRVNDANDLLVQNGEITWFYGNRIETENTHGTGCTLSSAIAANLAKGYSLKDAISSAKEYLSGALSAKLNLGKGSGPMNHAFDMKKVYQMEAEK